MAQKPSEVAQLVLASWTQGAADWREKLKPHVGGYSKKERRELLRRIEKEVDRATPMTDDERAALQARIIELELAFDLGEFDATPPQLAKFEEE
ncbi:MAG TPA: hypothetical protein VGH28_15615 [Polyangiaceae bacterium]|jgi:hypothetical protein